jgi:hypothetical protein
MQIIELYGNKKDTLESLKNIQYPLQSRIINLHKWFLLDDCGNIIAKTLDSCEVTQWEKQYNIK